MKIQTLSLLLVQEVLRYWAEHWPQILPYYMHKTEPGCFSGNPSGGVPPSWADRQVGGKDLPMFPWRQVHTIPHLQWVAKHVPACTAHARPNPSLIFTRSGGMCQEIRGKQRHQENNRKKVTNNYKAIRVPSSHAWTWQYADKTAFSTTSIIRKEILWDSYKRCTVL